MAGSGSCCQGRSWLSHEGCCVWLQMVVLGCSGPREHSWRVPAARLGELGHSSAVTARVLLLCCLQMAFGMVIVQGCSCGELWVPLTCWRWCWGSLRARSQGWDKLKGSVLSGEQWELPVGCSGLAAPSGEVQGLCALDYTASS